MDKAINKTNAGDDQTAPKDSKSIRELLQSQKPSDMVISVSLQGMKTLYMDSSILSESVDSLKQSVDSNVEKLQQFIPTNFESIKGILNKNTLGLYEKLNVVADGITKMNGTLDLMEKNRKLEWAISNTNIGSFFYYEKESSLPVESTAFVREVLMSFRKGVGFYIFNRSLYNYTQAGNDIKTGEKKFRDALSLQVGNLIGQTPRVCATGKGYAIYYN